MTANDVKVILTDVRTAYKRYILAKDKAQAFRDMAVGSSSRISDIPHVRSSNITENKLVYFLDGDAESAQRFAEYENIRIKAETLICSLSSDTEKEVLTRRYLLFQRWDTVAEKMGLSERHTRRLHNKAIENICEKN